MERLEVADDVFLGPAGGGRADDHAAREAVRLAELLDDAAQARPLFARLDLARHTDVVDRRHEDQEAPRHGDVRGETGALRAERLLHHLHQDFLPFLQQVLDARLLLRLVPLSGSGLPVLPLLPFELVFVAAFEPFELLEGVDDLGDVEEPVALETEIDEGRLHAGKNFRYPALVDIADDTAVPFTLDKDLRDEIVLEDGHHRLVAIGGDDHLLGHARTPGRWAMSDRRRAVPHAASPIAHRLSSIA